MASSISQVRVAVRARPLTSAERGRGGKDAINVNRHSRTVANGNNGAGMCFTYIAQNNVRSQKMIRNALLLPQRSRLCKEVDY